LRRSGTLAWYRDIHYRFFFEKLQRVLTDEEVLAEFDLSIQSLGEEQKKAYY
jgi:hypothetical protein